MIGRFNRAQNGVKGVGVKFTYHCIGAGILYGMKASPHPVIQRPKKTRGMLVYQEVFR